MRDATEKNALEAKKKKRKKSLSSRNTKTRRHINDASVRVPFLSATTRRESGCYFLHAHVIYTQNGRAPIVAEAA